MQVGQAQEALVGADLAREEVDHALERIETECLRHRRPQVRVGVDVVDHQAAVAGLEVLDAGDVELARRHDALAPGHGLLRHFPVRIELHFSCFRVARRCRAEVELAVRNHAHGVQQLAAEELHAHDALGCVGVEVFLKQQQVVGKPVLRLFFQQSFELSKALHEHDARAAAALLRLEQHREGDFVRPRADRFEIVEGPHARGGHAEPAQQRGLRGLAELERERIRAVQHPHAADLQRAHVRERVGHGAGVAAHICRRAGLVEVERRERLVGVGERGLLQVDRGVADTATLERGEQRLLPLGMLVENGKIVGVAHANHFPR